MAAAPGSGHPDASGGVPPVHPPAFCYRHPMRETLIRCVRCNRPICSDCMRPASVGFQCPDDVKLGRASQRPLRTSVGAVRRGNRPYVTGVLVALNVAVYVVTAVQSVYGFNRPSRSALFEQWQMLPAAVGSSGQYYRLLTATFLHANVLHIVTNMLALIAGSPWQDRVLDAAMEIPGFAAAMIVVERPDGAPAVVTRGMTSNETARPPTSGTSGSLIRHVVLAEKERIVARRHGTLLRSGQGMLLDETTFAPHAGCMGCSARSSLSATPPFTNSFPSRAIPTTSRAERPAHPHRPGRDGDC